MKHARVFTAALVAMLAACGGGGNVPNGSVVNSPGGSGNPPPTKLVNVKVTVTVPRGGAAMRPDYVSINTDSLAIQLASVDGGGVTGVNATIINTTAHSHGCKAGSGEITCTGTAFGSPGQDVFAVTTYGATNATGAVLSVGTVQAHVSGNGGNVPITNSLSLALDGVIASLKLALSPNWAKRGKAAKSAVSLTALDASGAQIVGPSRFASPIALTIQGDTQSAFALHDAGKSGESLTIVKPVSGIALSYDGDGQASPITVQGAVDGPSSIGVSANFELHGKVPPPPVGTIYALNLGASSGRGATVTEYDGKANGNAAPERTLALDSKLYARSIAVDASGNLWVGYLDNSIGHDASGFPDSGNEVAIYAPNASGNQQPAAVLTADKSSKTTLFPVFTTFDASGNFVTYGATGVDHNGGNDAVLTYAPGSSGAAAPSHGWDFSTPQITYAGPTGLAMDASGNFYVNGALHTTLGPSYGLFVAPASAIGDPSATPSRTIPWDDVTGLRPGSTTLVALDAGNEVVIGNAVLQGSGSSESCQGRANVFAAGATGGTTDVKPLRTLTLSGVFTSNALCASPRDPRPPYFPAIAIYASTLYIADDFNDAIAAYPAGAHGTVQPAVRIAGAATGLSAPIALVITSVSGRAQAHPAHPYRPLHAR